VFGWYDIANCVPCVLLHAQYVKVGIVGGSDLVKIQEQLGDNRKSSWCMQRYS